MTLEDFGNVAEVVSAIGVVATLAYLAVQIRHSSVISRANLRQQLAGQQIDYLKLSISQDSLLSAFTKNSVGEPLSAEERRAFAGFATIGLRLFESCHAQWRLGTLSDDDWKPILARYSERWLRVEAYRAVFTQRPGHFHPEFRELVEAILAKQGAALPLHAADAPASHQIRIRKFAACLARG